MKWIKSILSKLKFLYRNIMEKFTQLGRDAVSKYPELLKTFGKQFDTELDGLIQNAYVLVDRKGRKQIHIQTVDGWEILEYSEHLVSELSAFLNKNIEEINLDMVAEMNLVLKDSLDRILKQASKCLSSAIKKM